MAVTSATFNAHITHVDKDGPLIKIFAQIEREHSYYMERFLYQFNETLHAKKELIPKTANDLTIGLICCAKFDDKKYYRAKIESLAGLREHNVLVFFIDHGNKALISVTDIRLIDKIATMNKGFQKLLELPNLAHEFYLGEIVPKEKEWDDSILELLRNKLCNTDLTCRTTAVEDKQVIKFIDPATDPVNILVSLQKGFKVQPGLVERFIKTKIEKIRMEIPPMSFSHPPPPLVTQHPPPARLPNLSQPPPMRMMNEKSFSHPPQIMSTRLSNPSVRPNLPGIRRPEANAVPPPVPALQLTTDMLTPGVSHAVYVSYVNDGPLAFAVQLQSAVHEVLGPLMLRLNSHTPQPITGPLNPGSICLGRYSLDKSLCRAIVTSVRDDKVKLYFADFGHEEVLPPSEIFQIPPEFAVEKVMSHRFTLANIKDTTYTDREKKLFKDLVANRDNLMMTVTPPEANPLKQYCELYINCKNIKVMLKELFEAEHQLRFTPLSMLMPGSQENVTVSFVLNPGRFFVQLDKNSFVLKQVMNLVATHCRTAQHIPLVSVRVSEPCCALYDDGKWYRAEIITVTGDKAYINFVDYGNQEEVELTNLREITTQLVNSVKAQAVACCLYGFENCYTVDEEVANRLEELILEQKMMMHVVSHTTNGVLIVRLFNVQGQDIGALLNATPSVNPAPTPAHAPAGNGWEDGRQAVSPGYNREERRPAEPRGARFIRGVKWPATGQGQTKDWQQSTHKRFSRDDNKKQWRSQEDSEAPQRQNKDSGGRWNDGPKPERRFNNDGESRFNNDDNRGGRFRKDDDDGGKFNREGGRFGRDSESRGGRFGEDKGGRFNKEDGGGRFNKGDDSEKPWRKRDDDAGGWRNKDREDGGGWNKDKGSSGGGWKDRESPGSWKDGGGDRKNKFDSESGFKRGGFNRDASGEDGGFKRGGYNRDASGEDGGFKRGGFNRDSSGQDGGFKRGGYNRDASGEDSGFKRGGFNRDAQGERGGFRKPWEKGSSDFQGRSAPKSPKPDTLGGIPLPKVKVGSTETTQLVFTTSPLEFYVQLNSSYEELNQLMEKIATACTSGEATDLSSPQEKTACLAQYSADETWYRAYIEQKTFDNAKVLFVDYGNREDVPFDKIKTLPEDMSTLPVQAIKCRLYGVPDTADTEAFTGLVDGKNLVTQFVAKHFLSNSFQVILVDEEGGSNVNTAMGASEEDIQCGASKLGLLSLSPARYAPGATLSAQMTWYVSPAQFYLQSLDTHPEFRAMMQSMQTVVRTGTVKQNNQLGIGDHVIARFKADKVLYRALVKEVGFLPTVQYVDYGNTESVDSGAVWAMEPEYATLPTQAVSCCLAGVQPTGDAWPKANSTALDQIFEVDSLECTVVSELEGETQYLVRLTAGGQDLAQKVIDGGFGTAGSDGVGAPVELDTSLLVGQLLPVRLVRVVDHDSVYVQPATEDAAELQSLEAEAGSGIKCSLSSVREDATEEERSVLTAMAADSNLIVRVDAVQTDGIQVTLYDGEGKLLPLQASETTSVSVVCPLPILNTHQKVWVSHAGDDGIFLQKTSFGDLVSDLLQKLYEFYNETEPVEQEWAVNQLCCAKSANDEQWYRAKVIETDDEIKVHYLDYGNCESLPAGNLRKLDSSFFTPHAFAVKASFHVTWTVPVENLLELTEGIEYSALILRKDSGWIVELVDSAGQSLTDKLVELGFANALENSPFKRIVEGGRFVAGSSIPISVSFIDSPIQIWIFIGDDIELIEALQDRLQEAAPKLPHLNVPNGIFAAKFSDGLWYRATKLDDSKVRFIDYGNSDVVDMSDIKALSADFLESAEGYAVKLELPLLDFKDGAKEKLEELLVTSEIDSEEEIIAQILTVKENAIVADILKGGKSVVDILIEENLGTRIVNVFSGFVSHTTSLNSFFIQEVGCEELLEAMATTMSSAENFQTISTVNVDSLIAALFPDDGTWYRAKVIAIQDNVTEVLFIDYGNSSPATEFRELPNEVAAKPPLAKHCALQLPDGVPEWSEAATNKFIELSADGCTQFDVRMVNDNDPATVVLTCNGKCVIEELTPYCFNATEAAQPTSGHISLDLADYDKVVYVSHVNNLNSFYVQVEGAETELESIKEQLLDTSFFEAIDQISDDAKEKIIGALFDDDETWYRAKILKTEEDKSEVLFVDYGNSATSTKFIKLSEDLESKKPVAIHCTLEKREWPEEAQSHFAELTGEGSVPFYMKTIVEGDPNLVSLITGETIVEKDLAAMFIKTTSDAMPENNLPQKESTLPKSETPSIDNLIKTVYLIQVNSPSDFFLHTSEATQQIEVISERLVAAGDFSLVEDEGKTKGTIVAAQFDEDDLWYRAKILEITDSETKVLFIDYGNTAKVAKIKSLPEDLVATPPLAMHCSLQIPGIQEWSLKACETFNKLANDDGITFDLKIISEGEPNEVALYIDGESVAEQLVLASGLVTDTSPAQEYVSSPGDFDSSDINDLGNSTDPDSNNDTLSTVTDIKISAGKEIDNEDPNMAKIKVTISHFNNINDFYVQNRVDEDTLDQINEEMVDAEEFETSLDNEEVFAAKYTSDGLWYRAKMINKDESGDTVLFIDYGNTDITNEFRKLPTNLVQIKPLAKHCRLKSTKDTWTDSANQNMEALSKAGVVECEMKIFKEGDPCLVDLFVAEKSLMETFTNEEEKVKKQTTIGENISETVEKEICDKIKSSVENTTESLHSENHLEKQNVMGDMIMNSVVKAISENVESDVKQITDDLLINAINHVNDPNHKESQNSILADESKLNKLNCTQFDAIKKVDLVKTLNSSNDEKDLENPSEKHDDTNSTVTGGLVSNSSPPTPRRTNIDDHIVPGCISSVQLDENQS